MGDGDGFNIVKQLIVDDGNSPAWGHRVNIYNRKYTHVGISCGCHGVYGDLCLFNYAVQPYETRSGRFVSKRPAIAHDADSCKDSTVASHPASDNNLSSPDDSTYERMS